MTSKEYIDYLLTCGKISSKEFEEVDKSIINEVYTIDLNIVYSFNELVLENGLDLNNYFELLKHIKYNSKSLENVMKYRRDVAKYTTKGLSISKIRTLNESLQKRKEIVDIDKILLSKRIFLRSPISVNIGGEPFRSINSFYNDETNIPSITFKSKERDIKNVGIICFYKDKEDIVYLDDKEDRFSYYKSRISFIKDKISNRSYDIIITIFETRDINIASDEILRHVNYQFNSRGINF